MTQGALQLPRRRRLEPWTGRSRPAQNRKAEGHGDAITMTLVVARLKDGVISAVSDTGISFNEKVFRPEQQIPKLCILSPDLAVGFAGDSKAGIDALSAFPHGRKSYEEVTHYFLGVNKNMNGKVDFLILCNKSIPKMVKIIDGLVRSQLGAGWIGDKPGFEVLQEQTNITRAREVSIVEIEQIYSTEPADMAPPMARMIYGLRRVIYNNRAPWVSGFCVALNSAGGAFRYRNYGVLLGPSGKLRWQLATPAQLHLNEVNAYADACFASKPDDACQALAYHFLRGKITYMFHGLKGMPLSNAVVKRGNLKDFQTQTSQDFGINWKGGLLIRDSPDADYGM